MFKKTFIIIVSLSLLLLAGSFFLYQREKELLNNLSSSHDKISLSPEALVAKVGEHTAIPTDEKPVIIYIRDEKKAREQAFFAKATVGDIVLVYEKNKRAILYDPATDQILQDAPVLLPTPTAESSSSGVLR